MSRERPLTLTLYRAAASLFGLAAPFFLALRRWRGKEHVLRSAERRGHADLPRPSGPLVWLHGASVGEAVTVLPLAERLLARGCGVLVTSGTVTSAAVVSHRLAEGGLHQFVPLDVPRFVGRFLDHWKPDLALFVESELWPVTIEECHRRRIPLVLVNGRMSPRSFRRWSRFPATIGALLGRFDLCLAQSALDEQRFAALAAPHLSAPGNLKFDAPPPPVDVPALAALAGGLAGRPTWLAASTHAGEESAIIAAHRRLQSRWPGLVTMIVPRHPERGDAVAAEAMAAGLRVLQRSRGFLPDRGTQLYVADTVGELGLFYRAVDIVFVGGSLVRRGGQNPLEPAKLSCAVLHGPHTHNFIEAYGALDAAGAATVVADAEALAAEVARLLESPAALAAMTRAGGQAVASLGGALDRTMTALEPYLMQFALRRA